MEMIMNLQPLEVASDPEGVDVPNYFARKAWPVRIIGGASLVITSPLILLLVILVRITSPGPGLYRQARSGRRGQRFMMYKIRTMYNDAESVTGPVWCMPGDSRITPLGKALRFLHLDELPQLINVARGEMDLVGPRPERPVFVASLTREIPNYQTRLQVLPGITGIAQINLPPDETIDCVRKKVILDCAYIKEASFLLDLRIVLCSWCRMFGIRHGHAVRWLRLGREVRLPPQNTNHSTRAGTLPWLKYASHEQPIESVRHTAANGLAVAAVGSENGAASYASTLPEISDVPLRPLHRPR